MVLRRSISIILTLILATPCDSAVCVWSVTDNAGIVGVSETSKGSLRFVKEELCKNRCDTEPTCTGVVWDSWARCFLLTCTPETCVTFNNTESQYLSCSKSTTPTADPRNECLRWDNTMTCLLSGQECVDPDFTKDADWECQCISPANGVEIAAPADCFRAGECLTFHQTCTAAGQSCRDPNTKIVGDWECVCVAPTSGSPRQNAPADCFVDECLANASVLYQGNASCPPSASLCYDPIQTLQSLNDTQCVDVLPTPPPEITLTIAASIAPDEGDDEVIPALFAYIGVGVGGVCLMVGIACFCFHRKKKAEVEKQVAEGSLEDPLHNGEGEGEGGGGGPATVLQPLEVYPPPESDPFEVTLFHSVSQSPDPRYPAPSGTVPPPSLANYAADSMVDPLGAPGGGGGGGREPKAEEHHPPLRKVKTAPASKMPAKKKGKKPAGKEMRAMGASARSPRGPKTPPV